MKRDVDHLLAPGKRHEAAMSAHSLAIRSCVAAETPPTRHRCTRYMPVQTQPKPIHHTYTHKQNTVFNQLERTVAIHACVFHVGRYKCRFKK
jgi:hypothetical protein